MNINAKRNWERRIEGLHYFYALCERVLLQTLLFGCFLLEVGRFVHWLVKGLH